MECHPIHAVGAFRADAFVERVINGNCNGSDNGNCISRGGAEPAESTPSGRIATPADLLISRP